MANSKKIASRNKIREAHEQYQFRQNATSTYDLRKYLSGLMPRIDEIYDGINFIITPYNPQNPKKTPKMEAKGLIPIQALEILAQQGIFEEGTLAECAHTHRAISLSPNNKHNITVVTTSKHWEGQVKLQMDYVQEPPSRRY